MPPKKRLRGPNLSAVEEEESTSRQATKAVQKPKEKVTATGRTRGRPTATERQKESAKKQEKPVPMEEESEDESSDDQREAEESVVVSEDRVEHDDEDEQDLTRDVSLLVIRGPDPVTEFQTMKKSIRRTVVEAFRMTFQSAGNINQDISVSTQRVVRLFQRVKTMVNPSDPSNGENPLRDEFFAEVDIRLTMMLDEVSVIENRARVFKMVALSAVELLNHKDGGDSSMLHFLLNFLEEWTHSTNVAARINTSSFTSYLFDTGSDKLPKESGTFCGFPIKESERMFRLLKRGVQDKEYQARVSAIRGMGFLQAYPVPSQWSSEMREQSPRELLMRSFLDQAWECRLVAVQSLNPKESDTQILSDIVYYDKCLKVRTTALGKFAGMKPNKYVREKIMMLDLCLKDHEVAVRDAAKNVLKGWVKRISDVWASRLKKKEVEDVIATDLNYEPIEEVRAKGYAASGQAIVLLWLSDSPETPEHHVILKRLCSHLFDVVRHMYSCHLEPVNSFADMIMTDLKAIEGVSIVTKSSISTILEDSEIKSRTDGFTNRASVFFWRCLVEYMSERKRSEADKASALMRFLSPLGTMVDHLNLVLQRVRNLEDEADDDEMYTLQMSFVENFLLVMRHAPSDQAGLDAYKKALLNMLLNMCYQKKVVDLIIFELSQFYIDSPEELFSIIYSKANEVRRSFRGGRIPRLEETILIGEARMRAANGEEPNSRGLKKIPEDKAEILLDLYELIMVNSALKAGILKKWHAEYDQRYRLLFERCLHESRPTDFRVLTVECIGIIAMYDLDMAADRLAVLVKGVKSDSAEVQGAVVGVIADIVVHHGVDQVEERLGSNYDVVDLLCDFIVQPEVTHHLDVIFRSVESLAKILLNVKINPDKLKWRRAVLSLMYRAAFRIASPMGAKIRSTTIMFLKFFCSLKRMHQSLLMNTFGRFFEMWSMNSSENLMTLDPLDKILKLKRCAATYVALTRHSTLPIEEQLKYQPVHVDFMTRALSDITASPDSVQAEYLAVVLPFLEYETFNRASLNRFYGDLDSYIGVHEEDSDKGRYNELRRIQKRVAKLLGINKNDEEEEIQRAADARRAATKAKKAAAAAAAAAEDDHSEEEYKDVEEEEEEEEEEGPSTSAPVTRRGRPARNLAASATRKKKEADPMELMQSPTRTMKRPPSRQNTASRPAPSTSSTRSAPPRSARKLRSDK
ncbi:unnamed protein product [Caenorhabditis sp. 36 PRJEB53466]|nr:unnamed protein product [Caenorhabditis sp. 36 PRJEB53466]